MFEGRSHARSRNSPQKMYSGGDRCRAKWRRAGRSAQRLASAQLRAAHAWTAVRVAQRHGWYSRAAFGMKPNERLTDLIILHSVRQQSCRSRSSRCAQVSRPELKLDSRDRRTNQASRARRAKQACQPRRLEPPRLPLRSSSAGFVWKSGRIFSLEGLTIFAESVRHFPSPEYGGSARLRS